MAERVFLEGDGILVTTSRVVVSGTTYQLRNVNSVSIARGQQSIGWGALLAITGFIIVLFFAVTVILENLAWYWWLVVALIFVATVVPGIRLELRKRLAWHLFLTTTGREVQALSSPNRGELEQILRAVNDAIAAM